MPIIKHKYENNYQINDTFIKAYHLSVSLRFRSFYIYFELSSILAIQYQTMIFSYIILVLPYFLLFSPHPLSAHVINHIEGGAAGKTTHARIMAEQGIYDPQERDICHRLQRGSLLGCLM